MALHANKIKREKMRKATRAGGGGGIVERRATAKKKRPKTASAAVRPFGPNNRYFD
jgi:hypothetical protein